mgnify:CR=1 FL=1
MQRQKSLPSFRRGKGVYRGRVVKKSDALAMSRLKKVRQAQMQNLLGQYLGQETYKTLIDNRVKVKFRCK